MTTKKLLQKFLRISEFETYLEKEREWDPLIITVITFLIIVLISQARLSDLTANNLSVLARQGIRVCNPTKSVDYMCWNCTIVYAIYRIAYEINN